MGDENMKTINTTALILIIIGALNWGLIAFFSFNLVAFLLGGSASMASKIVYGLVGLAGLWTIYASLMTPPERSPRIA
jgi:uncharacterized membrane protein YuzA (DUF378 family)